MKTQLTGILLILLTFTGCVKETLDKCPEGNVRIKVYAEKFQTNSDNPTQDAEEQFNKRIQFLHYILYRGNEYIKDVAPEDVAVTNGPYYELNFGGLPMGDYQLVVIGNCSSEVINGDMHIPGTMTIHYSGVDATEDLFAASLNFTVDCDCPLEFQTKLRRLQGVVRCRFTNLPDGVTAADLTLRHLNSSLGKGGVYSQKTDITKHIQIAGTSGNQEPVNVILGTFPTTAGHPASYELTLYNGDTPVFHQILSTEINIIRNQLVELWADFSNGQIRFEIRVNSKWDEYINGGEIEIN